MGGPAAGLWLAEERSALEVVPWLESFCDVKIETDASLKLDVQRPSVIGLHELAERSLPRPFALVRESLDDFQELGFPGLDRPPAMELALIAHCNQRDDHLILGHLTLFLAERLDALIDFDGLLGYPESIYEGPREEENARRTEALARLRSLPGRVWEIPYLVDRERQSYVHVGDRELLSSWLRHPDFHMVK